MIDWRRIAYSLLVAASLGVPAMLLGAAPGEFGGAFSRQGGRPSEVAVEVVAEGGVGVNGVEIYSAAASIELLGRTDEEGRSTVRLVLPSKIIVVSELFRTQTVECSAGQSAVRLKLERATSVKISVGDFRLPEDRVSIEVCDPTGRVFRDPAESSIGPRLNVMGVEKFREELRVESGRCSHVMQLKPVRSGSYWLPDVMTPSALEFRLVDALGGRLCEVVHARHASLDGSEWAVSVAPTCAIVRPKIRLLDSDGSSMPNQKFRAFAVAEESRALPGRNQLAVETDAQGCVVLPPVAVTVIRLEQRVTRGAERRAGEVRLREGQSSYEVVMRRQ